jgi:hypothetical protein
LKGGMISDLSHYLKFLTDTQNDLEDNGKSGDYNLPSFEIISSPEIRVYKLFKDLFFFFFSM